MVLRARMVGQLEVVTLPLCSRSEVDELRRSHLEAQRHGEKLFSCVQCGGPLHPIRFRSGLDIFGHDPGAHETCVLARSGESVRHEMLKSLICSAAGRVAGFSAEVEVRGDGLDPGTGYPPVVDVVATNLADRSRHGWEVQLSAQTDALVYHRQEVRASFLSQCSWETTAACPVWADHVPWLGLDLDGETWRVTGGLVVPSGSPTAPSPVRAGGDPEPLTRVVGDQVRPSRRRLSLGRRPCRWLDSAWPSKADKVPCLAAPAHKPSSCPSTARPSPATDLAFMPYPTCATTGRSHLEALAQPARSGTVTGRPSTAGQRRAG